MQKPEGLAKAAAVMAMVAALATMLAVNVAPPVTQKADGRVAKWKEIPAPPTAPKGGVEAAQGRGTAVERREAGGGSAPKHSSGSEQ